MSQIEGFDSIEIVDIDPYGTAIPYLSAAMNAIANHGMMCITCTDMRVLAGHDFTKCFYQYGATRSRISCFEENALRIMLATTNRIANQHQKAIIPMLSFQKHFYLRVFIKVVSKKSICWESLEKTGLSYYCKICNNNHIHTFGSKRDDGRAGFKQNQVSIPSALCDQCGSPWEMNGPIWIAPLNDFDFVTALLDNVKLIEQEGEKIINSDLTISGLRIKNTKEIRGMLESILQEEKVKDQPVTWDLTLLYKLLKTRNPKKMMIL